MTALLRVEAGTVSQQPVGELLREHDLTRRMLTLLERVATRVELGLAFPVEDSALLLTFFREFVEFVHHAKEAEQCFPAVTMHGADELAELVGELVADHEASKTLLHALVLFWEPGELRDDERDSFVEFARTYAARLRRHMAIEEQLLFPAIEALPQPLVDAIATEFTRVGSERRRAASWEREVAALERRYAD